MPLLTDILAWSTAYLSAWQRDALRRLFQQQKLTVQDIDDLYAMLKSARGLPDAQNRQPVPLTQDHLPTLSSSGETVTLVAMRDLKHVNRIADGQKLVFSEKGITIIYGDNGSGKSGYSRVLKRACRARDVSETVHTDASDLQASGKIPEAIFDIMIGGNPKSLNWKHDAPSPNELSTIAVFDGRCARAYLDEQDVAYLPYGLDIVENLAQRVMPELTQRLNAEIISTGTDISPFVDLQGDTIVGKLISSLSEATKPEVVTTLATLTPDEARRLAELEKSLSESDPMTKAKVIKLGAKRLDALISRIKAALSCVDAAAVASLKSYDDKTEVALKAEAVAAKFFQAGESLLPGTGEEPWKTLFETARRFSTELAYPGEPFPHVCAEARCLLCQQTLDSDAANRMKRFEEFVKADTSKAVAEKREDLAGAEKAITHASLGFGLDEASVEELKQLDVSLLQTAQEYEKRIEARRTWMLAALKSHNWNAPSTLTDDPCPGLNAISTTLLAQSDDLEKAGDETKRKPLETERAQLRARANLTPRLKSVLDLIGRMRIKASLTKCKDDLKTKSISDKAKELASQAVTAALRSALDKEFQSLGIGHIKPKLVERVEKGKMKHKLVLDLPVSTKLDEILSEGEQRAIAIGSFLAELHLTGHGGGIVFDDPVSSLDHHRRKKVARRLIEEAKKRQVIVLTHETVFLCELIDAIEQQNIDYLMHHLEWMNDHPGHVIEGLPWAHMDYKDRLSKLDEEQKKLEKIWPAHPNEEDRTKMQRQYSLLRATIERIIQDVVFNGVLHRYRDRISIDRLNVVVGFTESEFKEIERIHKACCEVIDSHDPSSVKNDPVPDAKQLGIDIADVRGVVKMVKDRRKK